MQMVLDGWKIFPETLQKSNFWFENERKLSGSLAVTLEQPSVIANIAA